MYPRSSPMADYFLLIGYIVLIILPLITINLISEIIMAQLSVENSNEVLFTATDKRLSAYVSSYTNDSSICTSPEDILADIEEEYKCPLIHLILR